MESTQLRKIIFLVFSGKKMPITCNLTDLTGFIYMVSCIKEQTVLYNMFLGCVKQGVSGDYQEFHKHFGLEGNSKITQYSFELCWTNLI